MFMFHGGLSPLHIFRGMEQFLSVGLAGKRDARNSLQFPPGPRSLSYLLAPAPARVCLGMACHELRWRLFVPWWGGWGARDCLGKKACMFLWCLVFHVVPYVFSPVTFLLHPSSSRSIGSSDIVFGGLVLMLYGIGELAMPF